MILYPAIDLVGGKAVRLYKGDYAQMTVYSEDPVSVAKDFQKAGATRMHLVDLEAAKTGIPANAATIRAIAMPEVKDFMQEFASAYGYTLDELQL